jgi:membrane peptidoglycan carboxypeptidase
MRRLLLTLFCIGVSCAAWTQDTFADTLEEDLGRGETRIRSAAIPLVDGLRVADLALAERLDLRGYERVGEKPVEPGTYFWGHERFWIYRRAHRLHGRQHDARLVGLALRRSDGRIEGKVGDRGEVAALPEGELWIEPLALAESLGAGRAVRIPVTLDELPERVWRPVLAAEDARFFEHAGVDGRSMARAAAVNARERRAAQGGSTITQQLIKNRDLTAKKSLRRKISEVLRALSIEDSYSKEEILEAYLNVIYYGHVDGLAVHGFGTAAWLYFSKPAARLTLAEAALLAAMIQGPNALAPDRHRERVTERRNWVLDRMAELGWVPVREIAEAKVEPVRIRRSAPQRPQARGFLDWVSRQTEQAAPRRVENQRGVVVETTLDPWLQRVAEDAVERHLERLREDHPSLRRTDLSAALVALDARSGDVLAWVGGDPADKGDEFDRVRLARRQPGSAIKPFVLLEAIDRCGERLPVNPATRIADEPMTILLPSGNWSPENFDRRFHGTVDLRLATRESYNVPFVRLARWCGYDAVAGRMRRAGLDLPEDLPPSFSLGALEATPLQMAGAFSAFFNAGRAVEPTGVARIELPGGRGLDKGGTDDRRVGSDGASYIVLDLMRDAVENGTGQNASIAGLEVAGKTGTSSAFRDAWFVGGAGSVVTAVWVGRDGGGTLGLTGATAAAPMWKTFMERAARARPGHDVPRPRGVVVRRVNPRNGLLYGSDSKRGREELFRGDALPRRNRFWRRDREMLVIR